MFRLENGSFLHSLTQTTNFQMIVSTRLCSAASVSPRSPAAPIHSQEGLAQSATDSQEL